MKGRINHLSYSDYRRVKTVLCIRSHLCMGWDVQANRSSYTVNNIRQACTTWGTDNLGVGTWQRHNGQSPCQPVSQQTIKGFCDWMKLCLNAQMSLARLRELTWFLQLPRLTAWPIPYFEALDERAQCLLHRDYILPKRTWRRKTTIISQVQGDLWYGDNGQYHMCRGGLRRGWW